MHDLTKSQTELEQELDLWHVSIHVKLNDGFELENTVIIDSVEYKRCLKRIFDNKNKKKNELCRIMQKNQIILSGGKLPGNINRTINEQSLCRRRYSRRIVQNQKN